MYDSLERYRGWEILSTEHVDAALFFAKNAMNLEKEFFWNLPQNSKSRGLIQNNTESIVTEQEVKKNHFAYVTGSIFFCVAFLNAAINEVFLEADKQQSSQSYKQLSKSVISSLAGIKYWKNIKLSDYCGLEKELEYADKHKNKQFNSWHLLNKFQLALYLADNQRINNLFAINCPVWKETKLLFQLRGLLTHYQPDWISYELPSASYRAEGGGKTAETTTLIMNELQSRGFWNRLCRSEEELDAEQNLGSTIKSLLTCRLCADLAVWGIKCSLNFVSEFYARMPIQGYKRLVDDRLEELNTPAYSFM
jgi:hypothetical protein